MNGCRSFSWLALSDHYNRSSLGVAVGQQKEEAHPPRMSIAAMNWAWGLSLSPVQKLVLMALADAADDEGVCWPSVATLARKSCVSKRTVQRTLQALIDAELLHAEARFRGDHSRSSNRYRLAMEGGDNLSRAPDSPDTGPMTPASPGRDAGVTPRTTKRTLIESPQPTNAEPGLDHSEEIRRDPQPSCGECELVFPTKLSPEERRQVLKLLGAFDLTQAQQLLDELAGRIARSTIRMAPLSYLRGLVRAAERGTFTPEVALQVAADRQRARTNAEVMEQAEARAIAALDESKAREDSPLAKRLLEVRDRARQRSPK